MYNNIKKYFKLNMTEILNPSMIHVTFNEI